MFQLATSVSEHAQHPWNSPGTGSPECNVAIINVLCPPILFLLHNADSEMGSMALYWSILKKSHHVTSFTAVENEVVVVTTYNHKREAKHYHLAKAPAVKHLLHRIKDALIV